MKYILTTALILCMTISMAQTESVIMKTDKETIENYLKERNISYEVSSDGIYYSVERVGEGEQVEVGRFISVHYRGKLLSGKVFDASYDRDEPIVFQIGIGQVIKGWDKGIPLFRVGGKGTLYIPSELAYGSREIPDLIPANSVLVFEVEVLKQMEEKEYDAYMVKMREEQAAKKAAMDAEQYAIDKGVIAKYLSDNNLKAKILESGLAIVVEKKGTGVQAEAGKTVRVNYAGRLIDGTLFDTSVESVAKEEGVYVEGRPYQPFEFSLGAGRVIKGWDEGIAKFKEGGKGKLIIPSTLAYGARSTGKIPKHSVLVFDIELIEVK